MGRRATATRRRPVNSEAGLTLDAGALIALERGDARAKAVLTAAMADGIEIAIPAGALAQAWRGGPRQHELYLLLGADDVDIVALDTAQALAIGELSGRAKTSDVIDASVAVTAIDRGHVLLTSDPGDLLRLAPGLRIIAI